VNNPPVVALDQVSVDYNTGAGLVHAVDGVSLTVHASTSTSIVGRSGSGKSTLVSLLSLLRRPTRGTVKVNGQETGQLPDASLSRLRGSAVGTVFQSFHLDPAFTAETNALMPWYFSATSSFRSARARARDLLEVLGIAELADRYPGQMSGGQRQRVAIARALFTEPLLLIADEPTGNLDEDTASAVADTLFALPRTLSTAVVVVTHDPDIAQRAERHIALVRGRVVEVPPGANPTSP
jgi:predicted ABC-type transport system involved in lysophospholipase L1 biosynthesis ATPase subunit